MKNFRFIYAAVTALALTACENEAPEASMTVTVEGACKAGEPVTFKIDGDAENIVFYSGEPGHVFGLRDRVSADNDLNVSFVSYTDQSTGVHPNFQVLVSSDFNGVYEPADVSAATWTDVTSQFTLPSQTGQNTPSGTVNLKQYVKSDGDLLYIAFRYFDLNGVGEKNRWVVRSINIEKVSPEGAENTLADIKTAGWKNVVMSGDKQWTLPGSQLLAAGNAATSDKDFWAISSGFNVRSSEPSTGTVIKSLANDISEFTYTYEKPGVYDAVFAGYSVWYNSEKTSTTSVRVTVSE